MASPNLLARTGRINGNSLRGGVAFRGRRGRIRRGVHIPLIALGSGVYAFALAFPIVLRQLAPPVYVAAFVGTALVLLGLHLRWTAEPASK